jgi:hypothetical protein
LIVTLLWPTLGVGKIDRRMFIKKTLVLLLMLAAACVTPAFAQVFWSNQSPTVVTDDIWCVTYANGTFAAVTNQGNLLTSSDGLTWGTRAIDSGVWLVSIAYGNGMWVVVGDMGTILVSPNLFDWVLATSPTANKLNGVIYNGTIWVAVGENGTIITSPDAETWTLQPAIEGVTGFLHGITYATFNAPRELPAGSIWICGANGVLILGQAPTATPATYSFSVYDPLTVLGASTTTENMEAILCPNVGNSSMAQQETLNLVGAGWGGTIISGGLNVGEGGGESIFVTATALPADIEGGFGTPTANVTPNVILRGLTYGDGYFVAAGEQGTILSSTDGVNWTQRLSGNSPSTLSTATLLSAAYSEPLQRFVVTGTGGTMLVSNAAPTVFGNVSTRGYVSSTQTLIGGFYIAGTAPRTVLIRADGPVLSTFNVPSPLPDPVLTVYNSAGTAVATNTGWTTNTNPTTISTVALQVGAFALPNPSLDSALLLTLPPGAYTAQITSATGKSGIALFEAYTD